MYYQKAEGNNWNFALLRALPVSSDQSKCSAVFGIRLCSWLQAIPLRRERCRSIKCTGELVLGHCETHFCKAEVNLNSFPPAKTHWWCWCYWYKHWGEGNGWGVANAGVLLELWCRIFASFLCCEKQNRTQTPTLCVGNRARIDLLLSLCSVLRLINVFKLVRVRGPNF